jgi:hypothetical protein
MGTVPAPLLSFNRGVIAKTTLARTDLDRTRLSAEKMTNWLPKTQGPMIMRPGTKYVGNSLNDTGAAWIEFVASTTQTALLELTKNKMRVWLPSDTGNTAFETPRQSGGFVPLARPPVDTTVSLTDTGWENNSTGGIGSVGVVDAIPSMVGYTTAGVTISASSDNDDITGFPPGVGGFAWMAADDNTQSFWMDTGSGGSRLPSWVNVDFGSGNTKTILSYSLQTPNYKDFLANMPNTWRLLGANYDTGTYATDTGKWALEDSQSSQSAWSIAEKRTFTLSDTGTADAWRHWRVYVTALNGEPELILGDIQLFETSAASQVTQTAGKIFLNATARGSVAKAQKKVIVSDTGTEHSLAVDIERGPVTLRVGSEQGDDDLISETNLGTGYHNLAFTPASDFHITLQSNELVYRIARSLAIGDSGTVEVTTPWDATNLDNIRYDQSADVVYADCSGVQPHKIERRGTGRSWSVVQYEPTTGPYRSINTTATRLRVVVRYGNTTMYADRPFFKATQIGSLIKMTNEGQSGAWTLGADGAVTDVITVTGISDTGTPTGTNERRLSFAVSGTYSGGIVVERSFDGPEFGFKEVTGKYVTTGLASDTGTFSTGIDDRDDNITVHYRARMKTYTSGAADVVAEYNSNSIDGTARIIGFVDSQEVEVEVLENFSDTGFSDTWAEGAWSDRRGFPSAVALHEGRLAHAGGANIWMSVSDDYENFDVTTEGEAAPIIRTLGSGPVDSVQYIVSLLRLIVGTDGSEITVKSSSFDETLTPTNSAASAFSTQGAAKLRAVKMDSQALFVQRSGEHLYLVGFAERQQHDYETSEMTILVPEILSPGVVSIAIQRQPDTRIHCALSDGTVAILTFEPQEEVLAWSKWVTDTGTDSAVERVMVLPGQKEDRVFYHIRRTINGTTRRFLEQWAREDESRGDTGLSWLADCAVSSTDTGAAAVISDFAEHLGGQTINAWANDTGQGNSYGKDLTPDDTGGTQQLLTLDTGGDLTLTDSGVKHVVGGLPYQADYRSTKLAYGAQGPTAMSMMKRVAKLALILDRTHNNALFVGSDTGYLDPMPRVVDEGATVDADKIFESFDKIAFPFSGELDEDSRLHIRGKSPRPATIMAALPYVTTNEN